MQGAHYGSAGQERRGYPDVAELDGLGMAAVILHGHDAPEPAVRVSEEPRTFAARSAWFRRWTGWRS